MKKKEKNQSKGGRKLTIILRIHLLTFLFFVLDSAFGSLFIVVYYLWISLHIGIPLLIGYAILFFCKTRIMCYVYSAIFVCAGIFVLKERWGYLSSPLGVIVPEYLVSIILAIALFINAYYFLFDKDIREYCKKEKIKQWKKVDRF